MSDSVVILGAGKFARMLSKYVQHDSQNRVVAFAVEEEYLRDSSVDGIEVVPLSRLPNVYPPDEVELLTGVGYHSVNLLRSRLYRWGKNNHYEFASYIYSGTHRVVENEVHIGEDCIVLENNIMQPGASLGPGVILWSGNLISHDVQVAEHTFIASGVMIGGDTKIGRCCFIGMGAVIREGVQVADTTFLGAGVTLLKNTEPGDVFMSHHPQPLRNVPSRVLHGFLVGQ